MCGLKLALTLEGLDCISGSACCNYRARDTFHLQSKGIIIFRVVPCLWRKN